MQQVFTRNVTILQRFSQATGGNLVTVYAPGYTSPWDLSNTQRYYGFIKSLRAKIDINSLAEAQIPDVDLTTSRTERMTAVRDMEWGAARMELELLMKTARVPWTAIAKVSLLRRDPYYHVNLLNYFGDGLTFEVGNDTTIGARIINAGYGLLSGTDEVVIFGCCQEEASALPADKQEISLSTPYGWDLSTTSQQILTSNPHRIQVTLTNTSDTHDVYLSLGAIAAQSQGITLKAGGGSYEINLSNPYKGPIAAIADGPARLTGVECV